MGGRVNHAPLPVGRAASALIASLESLGVLNHKQIEELHAYLTERLSFPRE